MSATTPISAHASVASRDPVTRLAKVKFLLLQIFCVVCLDFLPRLMSFLTGNAWRTETVHVFGSPQAKSFFELDTVDQVAYPDPRFSGHTQTILCALRPQRPIAYNRVVHPGGDGNPICVDWYLAANADTAKGLFVVIPGLASWSGTNYIQHFVWYAHARHFHCCVFNSRGMGDTPIEKPRLMSAKWTEDLRAVMHDGPLSRAAIEQRCGKTVPVIGIGFSLGGVILCEYAGEECQAGRKTVMDAVFIVNSPLDCIESSKRMERGLDAFVFQPSMIGGLTGYARRHAKVLKDLPGLSDDVQAAFANDRHDGILAQMKTVRDFDTIITIPTLGFATPEEYYLHISPIEWLPHFTFPVLCICAVDDPVCGPPPMSRLQAIMTANTNVSVVTTPHGGHMGYIRSLREEWRGTECFLEALVFEMASSVAARV